MEAATAEAPLTAAPVTAPPDAQPAIPMSFVDKVAAAGKDIAKPPAKEIPTDAKKTADDPSAQKSSPKAEAPKGGLDAKLPESSAVKKAVEVDDSKIDWKTAPKHFQQAHDKLLAKVKEFESKSTPKADELPEYKELKEKVTAKEKEYAELQTRYKEVEEAIRYADFEKSPEFQRDYVKPWHEAWNKGVRDGAGFSVPNEDGTMRKASQKEIADIIAQPDEDTAIEMAEKLFQNPLRAGKVLKLREEFATAQQKMDQVKAEYRTKGTEIEKQTASQRAEMRKQYDSLVETHKKEWAEKNPQWMKPDEGDEEGAKKLELGIKAADLVFSDMSNLSHEQAAKLVADTRNRAAAFGHVAHKLEQRDARIAELEAKLKEYEESEPGKGELKADAPVAEETFAQRLAKAVK